MEGHDDAGGVRLLVLALTLTLTLSYLPRGTWIDKIAGLMDLCLNDVTSLVSRVDDLEKSSI